ncbi:hypothetical protein AAMO2058_001576800 [Amorphochlora amoebiformis]
MTDESSTSTGARDAKSRPISDLLAEIQADIADNASSGSARRIRQPGVSGSGDGGGTTLMPGDNEDVAELEREMERALQKSSGLGRGGGILQAFQMPTPSLGTSGASQLAVPPPPRKGKRKLTSILGESIEDIKTVVRGKRRRKKRKWKEKRRTRLSEEAEALWGQANAAIIEGDTKKAKELCKKCIMLSPSAHEPYRTLGLVYHEEGDVVNALEMKKIAAHIHPKDLDLWREIAQIQTDLEHYREALYSYGRILRFDAKAADVLENRAILFQELHMPSQAMQAYERLIHACPEAKLSPEVLDRLSKLYYDHNKRQKVAPLLQHYFNSPLVQALDPNVVNMLIEVRLVVKEYKEAKETVDAYILKLDPSGPKASKAIPTLPIDLQIKYGLAILHLNPIALPDSLRSVPAFASDIARQDTRALGEEKYVWPEFCFSQLRKQDPVEYQDLLIDVAEACVATGRFPHATHFLARLIPETSGFDVIPEGPTTIEEAISIPPPVVMLSPEILYPLAKSYVAIAYGIKQDQGLEKAKQRFTTRSVFLLSKKEPRRGLDLETASSEAVIISRRLIRDCGESLDNLQVHAAALDIGNLPIEAASVRSKIAKLEGYSTRERGGGTVSRGRILLRERYPRALAGIGAGKSIVASIQSNMKKGNFAEAAGLGAPAVRATLEAIILDFQGEETKSEGHLNSLNPNPNPNPNPNAMASPESISPATYAKTSIPPEIPLPQLPENVSTTKGSQGSWPERLPPLPTSIPTVSMVAVTDGERGGVGGRESGEITGSKGRRRKRGPYAEANESVLEACMAYEFLDLLSLSLRALAHIGRYNEAKALILLYDRCRNALPKNLRSGFGTGLGASVSGEDTGVRLSASRLADVHVLIAEISLAMGNTQAAYRYLLRAARPGPLGARGLRALFTTVKRLGYPGKAERFLSRAADKYIDAPGYHLLYGHCQMRKRNYQTAEIAYAQAADVLPNSAMVRLCQGVAVLHQAMATSGRLRHALVFRGLSFFLSEYQNSLKKSRKEVEDGKVVGIGSEGMTAAYNLARALHFVGLRHVAMPIYETLLASASSSSKQHHNPQKQAQKLGKREIRDTESKANGSTGIPPLVFSGKMDKALIRSVAHNLAQILIESGAWELSRRIYTKHVVI